jgi:Ala-tRNA(Pro) deacylase
MYDSSELIELLKKENYNITVHQHNALFTVQDSKKFRGDIRGVHSKNLFLKNKKNKFFLFVFEETDKVDLKRISKSLELGNTSFAKEEYLDQYLKIKPGSVSPFALLNDESGQVDFYLEETLHQSKFINFHPLINTLTITIETKSFIEFMIENNKKIHIFSSTNGKVVKKYGKK